MSAHTPGPWFFEPVGNMGHYAIIDAEGFTVCNPSPMGQGNARLIVAAPDLLPLLQEMIDAVHAGDSGDYTTNGDWYMQAKEAIAKATG